MSALKPLCLVLAILLANAVQCIKICDLTDEVCTTKAANPLYKSIIRGMEGQVESSDPLYYGKLEGEVMSLAYKLRNITLTGLLNCEVTHLGRDFVKFIYNYFLRCPLLTLNSYYEVKGSLGNFKINGNGPLRASAAYNIKFLRGSFGTFIDEKDNTSRIYLKKSVDIEIKPKGNIDIDMNNLVDGDKEKSALAKKYLNENRRQISEAGNQVMKVLLMKMLMNHSKYLKLHRSDELLKVES